MKIKKFIIAWVVGFVAMSGIAALWHLVIMGWFYDIKPQLPFIVLAYLILAALMSYAYPIGYKGGHPAKEGVKFGIFIGLLWILPLQLILASAGRTTFTIGLVDAAWHVVEQGVGGIVMGLLYGRSSG